MKFFLRNFLSAALCFAAVLCQAAEPEDVVRKSYALMEQDSSTLEELLSCYVKADRGNLFGKGNADAQRKRFEMAKKNFKKFSRGKVVILKTNRDGDLCEIEYKLEKRDGILWLWLRKEDEQWRIDRKLTSEKWTKNRLPGLTRACAENLKQIGSALAMYANDNGGSFPPGDRFGLFTCVSKELSAKGYLKSKKEYVCPAYNAVYVYIQGQKWSSDSLSPLVFCPCHIDRAKKNYLNVLFCDGHVGPGPIERCRNGAKK